jgi:hypothetical protein
LIFGFDDGFDFERIGNLRDQEKLSCLRKLLASTLMLLILLKYFTNNEFYIPSVELAPF